MLTNMQRVQARNLAVSVAGASWTVVLDDLAAHRSITDSATIECARAMTSTLMTHPQEIIGYDTLVACSGPCGLGIRMCDGETGLEPYSEGAYVESDGRVYHEPDCTALPTMKGGSL